jgi:tRNA pseudouridine13 synthase
LQVSELDKSLGLEVYATNTIGIGGAIRGSVDDFIVEEVLVDGSVARLEKDSGVQALRASASRQRYLLCVLIKRNWDTFVALNKIAEQLGVDQTRIHVAGIKDAKAVTAQHITIKNVTVEDVEKIRVKDVKVLPVGYFRDELSTFYLLGNKFNIVIGKTDSSERSIGETIKETMRQLEVIEGIPNFFGHQRFGTIRPITHLVGRAIVNGDFEQAGMLFLAKPSQHEHPESRQAREELLSTGNFDRALERYPKQLRFERLMLRHLVKKPSDFIGAFKRLPFKLQMLFVQAYQSYLFNRFLSMRVSHGLPLNAAEVGDFVVSVERSGLPMVKMGKIVGVNSLAEINEKIKEGILRVALPLVGFRQKLSQGTMGGIEEEILDSEDAKTSSFRVAEIPKISGQGDLRPIVSPVKEFNVHSIDNDQVNLGFTLFRGSYATILLREIMKPDDPLAAGF